MSRLSSLGAVSPCERHPGRSPLFERGDRGDLSPLYLENNHVRLGQLAGGARRRITFFACAKKVIKESTPCFRRHPRLAPKSMGGSQTRPAGSDTLADFPRGFGHQPAASEGVKASIRDGLSPSEPPRLGERTRRAAKRGGLLLVTFLGQPRKVTRRRATPGQGPRFT